MLSPKGETYEGDRVTFKNRDGSGVMLRKGENRTPMRNWSEYRLQVSASWKRRYQAGGSREYPKDYCLRMALSGGYAPLAQHRTKDGRWI